MTVDRLRAALSPIIIVVAFLAAWQWGIFHSIFSIPEFAVPLPTSIVDVLSREFGEFSTAFEQSASAFVLGWILGNGAGFGAAVLCLGLKQSTRDSVSRALGSLQALPMVATAPIIALWTDSSLGLKVTTVVIMVFPQMLVYSLRGLSSTDRSVIDLALSYDASGTQTFRMFRLPTAIPHIFTGLKYSIVLALVGVVVCEIIRTADGLGYLIHDALQSFSAPTAWGSVVIISLIGIVSYLILAILEPIIAPWTFQHRDRAAS